MSTYLVEFTAYVNERHRPEGFPREVRVQEIFQNVQSIAHLQYLANDKFIKLVTSSGLVVLIDPDEPLEEGKITFDRRMFVNWSLLTHMTMSVKLITEPVMPHEQITPVIEFPKRDTGAVN